MINKKFFFLKDWIEQYIIKIKFQKKFFGRAPLLLGGSLNVIYNCSYFSSQYTKNKQYYKLILFNWLY